MTELETQIEALIDKHGARTVLIALTNIAYGKADHLHTNWQDTRSAKNWSKLGERINRVVDWTKQIYGMA